MRHTGRPRWVAHLAFVLGATGVAGAQQRTAQACAFDTTAYAQQLAVPVGLAPGLVPETAPEVVQHHLLVAQAISQHFVPPTSASLPFWARITARAPTDAGSDHPLGHGLHSGVLFRLTREGRLDGEVEVATSVPELNAAIIAAAHRADSARAFPVPGSGRDWSDGKVVLRLIRWGEPKIAGIALVRLVLPILLVDSAAVLRSMPSPSPRVGAGGSAGIETTLDLQFVVGADGKVVRGTVTLVGGRNPAFAESSMRAVERGTFTPAWIGGCPVPQLVTQRIESRRIR